MSLKKDFYTRVSIILTLSAVVAISVVIKKEREILLDDMRDKGQAIARVLSTVTMDSMLTYDYGTMERYVRQVVQDKDIVSLRIIRSDGEVLAESRETREGKGALHETYYPIDMGDSNLGAVEVAFSTERLDVLSRNIIISAAVFILAVHIIGLAVNNAIINSLVIRPISALITITRGVKEGRLKDRIEMKQGNEFGELAFAFNDMAASLDRNFDDLVKSRKEIQTEKNKLAAIVHSLADGLFVSDSEGLIVSFNRAAEEISGYKEQEAVGLHCEEVFKTKQFADDCARRIDDRTIRNKETEIITRDGRRRIVSFSSSVIRDSDGSAIGCVQTFRDVTEEKNRQALLSQAEKLAAVGEISAGIAHEINNPLGNIYGYAKLLLKEKTLTQAQAEKIEIIAEQAKKGSGIVRGLLDYSRQTVFKMEAVAVNSIITDVVKLLSHQAEKSKIRILTELTDIPDIQADPKQIEQVLFNLLMNAMQAIETSGSIWIHTGSDDGHVKISVKDSGPGIAEALRRKIFDPFFTTKPVGKGTGLGLSICAGIIKDHNGAIDVESAPGEGATFIVRLPVAKEENVKHTCSR